MPELDRARRFLVLAICCASVIVVVMDISIVTVALPAIRRDLHASSPDLQWTIDAYTIVLASFLLLAGSTADRYGRRRTFLFGLATFGLGSLLCGLAPSIGWLLAARVLQAVGGTMLNPVAVAIVATAFPVAAERARAIGVFGSMSGLALALGPILGGALVDGVGWRAVFWINVPIVALAIVGTALSCPSRAQPRARRFDPVGQILVDPGAGQRRLRDHRVPAGSGWTSPVILGLLAVAVLGVLGILGYEPRRADPLLELRLFRSVPFSSAILMALFALCGFGAFLFVTTQYLQDVRGMSALTAGLCLLPVGALIVVLSPFIGRLVGARGPRLPLVVAGAALAWAAARRSGSDRPPRCRPCSRSMCCSASSWARQPADHQHGGLRDAPLDGRVAASVASAGRQTGTTSGRRHLRNDRGIGPGPRRRGVHQRGARRVVAGARARRRHRRCWGCSAPGDGPSRPGSRLRARTTAP